MDNKPKQEGLWTVKMVAEYLASSESYVYKLIRLKEIPYIEINGTAKRFIPAVVREYCRRKTVGGYDN